MPADRSRTSSSNSRFTSEFEEASQRVEIAFSDPFAVFTVSSFNFFPSQPAGPDRRPPPLRPRSGLHGRAFMTRIKSGLTMHLFCLTLRSFINSPLSPFLLSACSAQRAVAFSFVPISACGPPRALCLLFLLHSHTRSMRSQPRLVLPAAQLCVNVNVTVSLPLYN